MATYYVATPWYDRDTKHEGYETEIGPFFKKSWARAAAKDLLSNRNHSAVILKVVEKIGGDE